MSAFYLFMVNICFLQFKVKTNGFALTILQMDLSFMSALLIEKDKDFAADIKVSLI